MLNEVLACVLMVNDIVQSPNKYRETEGTPIQM